MIDVTFPCTRVDSNLLMISRSEKLPGMGEMGEAGTRWPGLARGVWPGQQRHPQKCSCWRAEAFTAPGRFTLMLMLLTCFSLHLSVEENGQAPCSGKLTQTHLARITSVWGTQSVLRWEVSMADPCRAHRYLLNVHCVSSICWALDTHHF